MKRQLPRYSLFRSALIAGLFCAGCARSAIDEAEEEEDAYSIVESGAQEGDAAGPAPDAQMPVGADTGSPPLDDAGAGGPDAAAPDTGVAPMDSGRPAEAGAPEAGAPDTGSPAMDAGPRDAGPRDAAGPDAARDAAPDATPPAPKCTAGTYKGKFMGVVLVEFIIPLFEISIMGDISLTLAPDTGDRFKVQTGTVVGQDTDGNALTATVTGNVNCATGNVENGKLQGTYVRPPIFNEITFTGAVAGKYTNAPPAASGTWQTETATTDLLKGGNGTWSVTLTP
jgi:hypothetical protein